MSEHGEIYTAGKNFTLPPAVTAWTNSTSGWTVMKMMMLVLRVFCTLGAIPIHLWRESWVEKGRAARAGEEK